MLTLDALGRRFGDVVAVSDLSLEVARGEIVTLLGPSGCGKTTTLRMIAGFESPSAGRILLDGREITALSPQKRGVGMVFQNYALFPHLDVRANVEFGLRARGQRGPAMRERAERALALVELDGYGARRVQALSGGQQQRVALARALAPEPPLLLLDEPLSNLDAALRERTRDELRALLKRLGMTAVFVTHDQEEAFALSDRVAVLEGGRLQQVGTPRTLYDAPANAFVAGFLGRANFLAARVLAADGERLLCEMQGGPRWYARRAPDAPSLAAGDAARVVLRPEQITLERAADSEADGGADASALRGRVLDARFAGAASFYRVACADAELLVQAPADAAAPGDALRLYPAPGAVPILFPAEEVPPGEMSQGVRRQD